MKHKTILPVSRKFLARIHSRVSDVVAALGRSDTDFLDHIMADIHGYLAGRLPDSPAVADERYCCHLIFLTLRAEIDAAIIRSRRARECARRRAELRRQMLSSSPPDVTPASADSVSSATSDSEVQELDEKEAERRRRLAAFYEKERKAREAEVVEKLPGGEVRTTRPDGTVIVEYPDGEIRTTRPDGQVIVKFPNRYGKFYEKWLGDIPYYEAVEDPPIVMKGAPDRNSLAEQIRRAYGFR